MKRTNHKVERLRTIRHVRRVFGWLLETFSQRRARISMCFVPARQGYVGTCCYKKAPPRFTISLDRTLGTNEAISTLLHEYAHILANGGAALFKVKTPEDDAALHDDEFYQMLGDIERCYYYDGGVEACAEKSRDKRK